MDAGALYCILEGEEWTNCQRRGYGPASRAAAGTATASAESFDSKRCIHSAGCQEASHQRRGGRTLVPIGKACEADMKSLATGKLVMTQRSRSQSQSQSMQRPKHARDNRNRTTALIAKDLM